MAATATKLATFEDLLAFPEDVRGEVIGGVAHVLPPPLPEHGRAQGSLGRLVGGPFDYDSGSGGPGGWWIMLEVEVRFTPHDIVRPDLAGWRRVRLPEPWGKRPIDVVPDWICEVTSPSNSRDDRVRKRHLYAKHGVAYYWLVDPQERTLEALRLEAATQTWIEVGAYDEDSVAKIAPFDAIDVEVGRLFPPRTST